jgi:lipopolysaccharide export system protein LptC
MSPPVDRPSGPAPRPADEPSAATARRRLSIEQNGGSFRRVPNAHEIARRRRLLRWTKWVLPAGALLLLASIAAWPELERSMNSARLGLRQAAQIRVDSGRMLGARYRGLDGRDRPYMITADEAQQAAQQPGPSAGAQPAGTTAASASGDRINLIRPVADTLSSGGSWIRISAQDGVYMQHSQLLDLTRDVMLYRDDGIMMTGPVADLDLRRGIVASKDWVHAEGPFGMLDAQGYLMSQRDGLAQFRGPARLVLNDDRIARPAPAPLPPPSAAPAAGAAP